MQMLLLESAGNMDRDSRSASPWMSLGVAQNIVEVLYLR
jgi:hypothetical protein